MSSGCVCATLGGLSAGDVVTSHAGQPRAERFIALDSLRGLAALAVMLFHIGDFGWLGGLDAIQHAWLLVDFFFVLSGFVIAASYG